MYYEKIFLMEMYNGLIAMYRHEVCLNKVLNQKYM